MTLIERIAHCRTEGCRRTPAYPDQAYCDACRPKWMPEWRRRQLAGEARVVDFTGYVRSAA